MMQESYWFICYSSKNDNIVQQIVRVLKSCGIAYWKAPEMIPAGSNYIREVTGALKNCSVFLFIISKESQSSIWAEKELDAAITNRKKVIPLKIDDTPLNDTFLFYLNNIQMVDVRVQPNGQIADTEQKKLYSYFMEDTLQYVAPDKEKPVTENKSYKIDTRTNALRINKIPLQCERCGLPLNHIDVGTYKCHQCNTEYYDDFQKIRNYIRDHGSAPAFMIARNTGVSKRAVEYYFSDDPNKHYSGIEYTNARLTRQPFGSSNGGWHSNYGNSSPGKRQF